MSAKNYDPPSHTTEHILNRTMCNMFNCGRSVEAHLEKKKSKCDYRLDHELRPEEVQEIENKVNSVLQQNLEVKISFSPIAQLPPEIDISRLPDEAKESGNVRLITIGDYDVCPCIGPHVARTSDVRGRFRILSASYENGLERLRWTVK